MDILGVDMVYATHATAKCFVRIIHEKKVNTDVTLLHLTMQHYEDIEEENDRTLNCPPSHSESAPSNAPSLMVTGIRKRRILQPTNPNYADQATPLPLPLKPQPPPVPPRTYFTPPFRREPVGPPLPPRRYMDENEEAKALPKPTEVQSGGSDLPTVSHLSFETQDREPVIVPTRYPPTTVLLPNGRSLSRTESSECTKCENMKGVVRHMMNSNSIQMLRAPQVENVVTRQIRML